MGHKTVVGSAQSNIEFQKSNRSTQITKAGSGENMPKLKRRAGRPLPMDW